MSPATTRGPSRPPVERVRSELARDAGPDLAAQLPKRYVRLGHVLVVRWPETLRPHFPRLARSLARAHGARTVLRFAGPVQGELRTPRAELLFGSETETEVLEHGVRWRFDAARVLFATGNKIERARAGQVVQPGETVIDLFAGIGYFAIPAARFGHAARVLAVDRNPVSIRYLTVNARLNRVDAVVSPLLGDNRTIDLPTGTADRVFLGYSPPPSRGWDVPSRCSVRAAGPCTCIRWRTRGPRSPRRRRTSPRRSGRPEVSSRRRPSRTWSNRTGRAGPMSSSRSGCDPPDLAAPRTLGRLRPEPGRP